MSSRKVVLLVIALTLIVLIFGWFFMQEVMINFDVDRDTSQIELKIDKSWELAK
ncbi:hypothetical protein [Virgibacillus doumboii]|uniref:hypothetical protein n=1 Tax=Virgibacillus doumboii TaxID=2697503 RepID=UPI0013DEE27B|nr:hypothetical protein [Virgibacillus doumboii]